jgi:hypothetical protein
MFRKILLTGYFALISIGMILPGCDRNKDDHKTGWAVGYDLRECMCCGGLFVEYNSDTLLFPQIPAEIDEWAIQYGFPLYIEFDYYKMEETCGFDWYNMTYVELLYHP